MNYVRTLLGIPTAVLMSQNPFSLVLESQSKRRKLETGALYRFLPMVRDVFFSSSHCSKANLSHALSLMCTPRLSVLRHLLPKGRPFQKTEPVFIAPYLTFSLPDDARVAWLVPIRGHSALGTLYLGSFS